MAFKIFPRYDKEGPGVYVEELESRTPTTRFFQVLKIKFWKLSTNNIMHILFNLPMILLSIILVTNIFYAFDFKIDSFVESILTIQERVPENQATAPTITDGEEAEEELPPITAEEAAAGFYQAAILIVAMFLVGMNLFSVGPVQTGLSYLYRNYAREIPTFTWSDFKDSFVLNWKSSLKMMLINLTITLLWIFNIYFYQKMSPFGDIPSTIITAIFTVAGFFFLGMNIFIYPMLASLDLKVKHIYKNAALFFLSRFFHAIGILIVNVFLLLVIPFLLIFFLNVLGFFILMVYYVLIAFALVHYLNTFFAWQQIERFIVKPEEERIEKEKMEAENEAEE